MRASLSGTSPNTRRSWSRPAALLRLLLERLQVGDQRRQLAAGDDAAPVRHAHDRGAADHAAATDHGEDLRIRVELFAERNARERRDHLVRRDRVGYTAQAVRAVAVDAAV